ncbi:MAG: HEXXH motif-containing putative peptide modification protein [Myxococcota bacterium]
MPKANVTVPQDLTVPMAESRTARGVLSASLGALLRAAPSLPPPPGAPARFIKQWAELARLLRQLARANPGALASVFRWTHVSTLARCISRGHRRDFAVAAEYLTLVVFELWALGVLDRPIELQDFARRIVTLPRRATWSCPAEVRVLRFEGPKLLGLDADGRPVCTSVRDAVSAGTDAQLESTAHALHGGLTLALEDNNPIAELEAHPDKFGNALSLGDRSADDWVQTLDEALGIIEARMPTLFAEMQLYIQRVVPVGFDDHQHLSASYAEAIGTVYLSLHPNAMVMAEALIHEFSHNKLNALFEIDRVLLNAFTSMHSSPVRPDPRPLHGVLLAAHAFLPVAKLYERLIEAKHPWSSRPDFRRRLAQIVASNHEAVTTVVEAAQPTTVGRGLVDELARLDAHFMERYYDAGTAATDLG